MINQDNILYSLIKAKELTVENGVTISKMHNVQYLINQVLELSGCGVFDRSEHDDFNEVVNKYKESRIGYLANRSLLTKESSDYSYYEKEASKEDKLVYTQAMKDAGEMPRVGMVVDIYDREVQNRFFDSVEIKFVSDYNIAFMSEDVEIAGSLSRFAIKPVDTRTPENKLIDEMMAVIWSAGCSVGQRQGEIIAKALAKHWVDLISDKPKMKVEYVKVSETPREIYQMLLSGDELYVNKTDKIYFDGEQFMRDDSRITYIKSDNDIYRKVETEITWQSEMQAFIKDNLTGEERDATVRIFSDNILEGDFVKLCHLVSSMNK